MPSRQPEPTPPPLHHRHHPLSPFIPIAAVSAAALALLFLLVALLRRKLSRRRSATSDLNQPRRFSYSALRRATSSFSASNKLGQGGFGSVYRAAVPSFDHPLAVKLMDSGSLQGDREFQNELSLAAQVNGCDRVVSLVGYSHHQRGARLLLVYELMPNGSLQDALLDSRRPEMMTWRRRFSVALDVANGLLFLHYSCDPPIIHGDIKPSNVLLDCDFSAKIADFGLARVKTIDLAIDVSSPETKNQEQNHHLQGSDDESLVEETESVTTITTTTVFEEGKGNAIAAVELSRSPEEASNSETLEKVSASEGNFDKVSIEEGRRKDWLRRPEAGGSSNSSGVKDYVIEWIGKEIRKERPKSDWIESEGKTRSPTTAKSKRKKQQGRLEWWASLDDERARKKCRPPKVWWREEFCDELSKKKKRTAESSGVVGSEAGELWWETDEEASNPEKKKKKNNQSHSSIDWWMDGLSGEFRFGRRCSLDRASGEIPKSAYGISSTPSMRGTVCYIAPECGGGRPPSEKCDVYSYGVLLLVIIAGRRPLQVTGSPMSEFERTNLISWARHLARRGKLLDLVDPAIEELDREQALLCITVALLCLQRLPLHRPSIKQVVGMLSGESEPPHLPVEFSPSPPSACPYKSRKKAR